MGKYTRTEYSTQAIKKWHSMTEEERIVYQLEMRNKKQQLKELKTKIENNETLSLEEQELVDTDKKLKTKTRKNNSKNTLNKIIEKSPQVLEQFKSKVNNSKKLFSMDLEFCVVTNVLTEVGVCIYEDSQLKTYHFIVEEFKNLKHWRSWCPNNKDKFDFGTSEILTIDEIEKKVFDLTQNSDFYVGHAFKNDKQFLTQAKVYEEREVLDTLKLSKYYFQSLTGFGLEKLTNKLELNPKNLHNGGNDAYYTMKSLLTMVA